MSLLVGATSCPNGTRVRRCQPPGPDIFSEPDRRWSARPQAMDAYQRLRPWTAIEACECSRVESLLLVDLLTDNPLHCGSCRREVDPERLRLSAKETDEIASWFSTESALYRLWLDSGEYEGYAKSRLLDPKGQVNVRGLEIATALSSKIPTKLWFFSDADDGEPSTCPICGAELDTNVKWGTGCCEPCKIQI